MLSLCPFSDLPFCGSPSIESGTTVLTVAWFVPATRGSDVVVDADATAVDALRFENDGAEVTCLVDAGTVPGVLVLHASGRNGPGTGSVRTNSAATGLQYKAPGSSTYGLEVSTLADGIYVLQDGDDIYTFIRVKVYTAYLEADAQSEVQLRDVYGNAIGYDDVTAGEALAGDVTSYEFQLRNAYHSEIEDVAAWVDVGVSGIEISDDEVIWVSPTTEGDALLVGSLPAGVTRDLFVRRTIAAASASDAEVLTLIHFTYIGA